ncbi:hypothetical protein ACIQBJ_04070 [Kitasatospora sp. NPDC088391]|uniref:hypothetical protein n=1 Tax=Kitasatospora sp. NPDC088391 TaxID=3364074 RepID=UPI0037FE35E9
MPDGETAEILAALWAHALPADGLQHITARGESDRTDLLIYLRTLPDPAPAPDAHPAVQRAHHLIARTHRASPLLHRSHLPPDPPAPAVPR